MLVRILVATGTIFFSLILGAILLAVVGYNNPELLSQMLGWARELKLFITSRGLAPHYNIWLELLLEERQLLFMAFVILGRILIAIVMGILAFLWSLVAR